MVYKTEEEKREGLEYEVYINERASLNDAGLKIASSLDKYVLTYAAAALGLSLAFIQGVVGDSEPSFLVFFILGWAGFIITILLTLIALLTSQAAYDKQIDILEKVYIDGINDELKNAYGTAAKYLTILSVVFFVTGTVLLFIFVSLNL